MHNVIVGQWGHQESCQCHECVQRSSAVSRQAHVRSSMEVMGRDAGAYGRLHVFSLARTNNVAPGRCPARHVYRPGNCRPLDRARAELPNPSSNFPKAKLLNAPNRL